MFPGIRRITPVNVTIHRDLGTPQSPSSAAAAAERIGQRAGRALLGHADFYYRAEELAAYSRGEDEAQVIILADDAAFLQVFLPRRDHTRVAHVQSAVLPERDPVPLLDALFPPLIALLREEGRTALTWWEYSRQDAPPLVAATGDGAVEPSPVTGWLKSRGFVLDQVEVTNTLHLPVELEEVTVDDSYELVTWVGATPEHLLDGMARLRARMSTDIPHGSREVEEAVWDAERIRREEAVARSARRTRLWAVALNAAGEPVGYTMVESLDRETGVAFQEDTLVRAEDRGHGLGRALKWSNLAQLQHRYPQTRRLHTWNAGENRAMLAINDRFGFSPTAALGAWQREVTAAERP